MDAIEAFNVQVVLKYNELIDVINGLQAHIQAVLNDTTSLRGRVEVLEARPTVSVCVAVANLGAFRIPISCKLQ